MNTLWTLYHLPRTPRGRALLMEWGLLAALLAIGLLAGGALFAGRADTPSVSLDRIGLLVAISSPDEAPTR